MAPAERALLYVLPLLRHLREYPHPAVSRGPIAVVLADGSVAAELKDLLATCGISMEDAPAGDNYAQRRQLGRSAVALLPPRYFRSKVSRLWSKALAQVSFVVVDDLGLWEREEGEALRLFSGHLPNRIWGPSIVWLERWDARVKHVLGALTDRPVTLRAADSVLGARVVYEPVRSSDAVARVAFFMHRYPGLRILVFADDPEALCGGLQRVDTQGRVAQSDGPSHGGGCAAAVVAPNRGSWPSDGRVFDVVLHVDAPPSPDEYRRRLAACRRLAVALVALDGARSARLGPAWLPLVPPRERRRLLASAAAAEGYGREADYSDVLARAGDAATSARGSEDGGPGASFRDDYSLGRNGELVWDAGQEGTREGLHEEEEEEFAVFSDSL
mmetsp:Transcript_107695/g.322136  ORF Transcript_107695/g.322136 Transcript_107695/m.322136 type:complete len:387 (-) Transcript_107695:195-1355(-)